MSDDDYLDEYDVVCRKCNCVADRMGICPTCDRCPDCCEEFNDPDCSEDEDECWHA